MEISIDQELQCQALLAYRYAQDQQRGCVGYRNPRVHVDQDLLVYVLLNSDPIPKGLQPGNIIYGMLGTIEESDQAMTLPMFTSTG